MSILSPEVLKALQQDYINGFSEKWKNIEKEFGRKSWSSLERAFHNFSGSGTTYKMPEISKVSKAIELYLEKCNPPDASLLREALDVFKEVLTARENGSVFNIENHPIFDKLQ